MTTHSEIDYKKWEDGIRTSKTNSKWHEYDCFIQKAINEYDAHLSHTPGYRKLDWYVIKAMIWTEVSGPTQDGWYDRPMQIGNPPDPRTGQKDLGLDAILYEKKSELIKSPAIKKRLKMGDPKNDPEDNIYAGIGYLLLLLAKTENHYILDNTDETIHKITVKPKDNLADIAKRVGSSDDSMAKLNGLKILKTSTGTTALIRAGQELKYQKASLQQVITGWKPLSIDFIAEKYNKGDSVYRKKLMFALAFIKRVTPENLSCFL